MTIQSKMVNLINLKVTENNGFELLYPSWLKSKGEIVLKSLDDKRCLEIINKLKQTYDN